MEAYTAPVIELLSLKQGPSGYLIEAGVTGHNGHSPCVMAIDEFTYNQLSALNPLGRGRARLSLYRKWDPYRNTYYSTLTIINGSFSETLYFACSDDYAAQLLEWKRNLTVPPAEPEELRAAAVTTDGAVPNRRAGRQPAGYRAFRFMVIVGIMILFAVRMDGKLYNVEALSSLANANAAIQDEQTLEAAGPADSRPSVQAIHTAVGVPSVSKLLAPDGVLAASGVLSPDGVLADNGTQTANGVQAANGVHAANGIQTVNGVQTTAGIQTLNGVQGAFEAHTADNAQAAQQTQHSKLDYELIDIGKDKSFYSLPEGYAALTFDDGPSVYTKQIVDILTENKVAATFLFIGKNAQRYPDEVIYANEHEMSIGNHSWDHSKLVKAKAASQKENIAKANEILESLIHRPITIFRPPYGSMNDTLAGSTKDEHMKVLMWNRDPEDWHAQTPEDILRYIHQVESSGGIYVMHEDKVTVEALPEIIQYIKEKKLKFATFK